MYYVDFDRYNVYHTLLGASKDKELTLSLMIVALKSLSITGTYKDKLKQSLDAATDILNVNYGEIITIVDRFLPKISTMFFFRAENMISRLGKEIKEISNEEV